MRGSPVVRGLAVVAALLLLLVPLVRMTSGRAPAAPPPPSAQPAGASPVVLRLTSSSVPFAFSVSHLGSVIWTGESTDARVEKEVTVPFPSEGIDLFFSVSWEAPGPSALEVSAAHDGKRPSAQTVWGERTLSEVLTFR